MGLPDIDNIPDTGAVFTLGRSRFADNVASHFFIRKDPVVHIACGDEHSAVVCESGRLFVFGSNDWGQLGLGHKNHVSKPSCVKILKPERVTHVSCGRAHTLICTDDQKIFACGSDQESQLGRGQQSIGDSSSSPILIYDCGLAGPKIIQVAAGSHHSLALTSDGSVFAWGSNLEGQLGLSGISGLVNKPTKVHLPEAIKQISAGYYHSAFLTENGCIYVCGEAESGKLGIALDFRTQVAPKQMPLPVLATAVACGGHHTLVLGDNKNIYCTGSNASGQLGMGMDVTEIQTPKELPRGVLNNEKIKKLVCGESHIAIITESGKLFTCGDGRHGKLGLEENENNVHELTLASKYLELFITNICCGGCHTILVGHRRNDETENAEFKQMKIDPLPPLKVSAIRNQNNNQSKSDESTNKVEKMENNTTEKTSELTSNVTETVINNSINNNGTDECLDSLKKSPHSETSTSTTSAMSVNNITEQNSNHEDIGNKNNERVENLNQENNDNNTTEAVIEIVERPTSSKSNASTIPNDEQAQNYEHTGNDEKNSMEEKPSTPPLPVPPPKPPRQKIGSADSNESRKSASTYKSTPALSRNGSAKSHTVVNTETKNEAPSTEERHVEINDNVDNPLQNKSAGNDKSHKSIKSNTDITENVRIETDIKDALNEIENFKENVVEKVEEKINMIADDADVVQSSASRAGKIAKLFKGKRQEVENGTKSSCIPNSKAKSKACSIL